MNYDRFNRYFQYDPYVNSDANSFKRHVRNLRTMQVLPDLGEHVYFEDWVASEEERDAGADPGIQGVLLSHAHVDHHGCIKFLNPRIPVYCHPSTAAFYQQQHIKLYFYKSEPGKIKNTKANNELGGR
ncbi:MBL fold metallo-hydrolase [candidate division CSSED10-310 bacterium]|uniref:MBL fold metallo-hydrolase n=1 Tax=candidate division CSSED10-310 bacterium TaxID=2855610 RepID=A0ABV6YUL7_UNCC1